MTVSNAKPGYLLEMQDVARSFSQPPSIAELVRLRKPAPAVRAVDGVSLRIARGTTMSLVGESGCGKSTIARMIVGLFPPTSGSIRFDGMDLRDARASDTHRRRLQMIFQDPYASLNPRWRIGDIIGEPIRTFRLLSSHAEIGKRVDELLAMVGLSASDAARLPHELSGGQRQRVCIARALSTHPDLLVCDEPTSALDVSVQAQVVNLLQELQRQHGLTYLFISHNLAVVRQVSEHVGVMYLGRIVEEAPSEELFEAPLHPYTRALLAAAPGVARAKQARSPISGEVPSAMNPPGGCTFHPRCPLANERCKVERPALEIRGRRSVACHAVQENRN